MSCCHHLTVGALGASARDVAVQGRRELLAAGPGPVGEQLVGLVDLLGRLRREVGLDRLVAQRHHDARQLLRPADGLQGRLVSHGVDRDAHDVAADHEGGDDALLDDVADRSEDRERRRRAVEPCEERLLAVLQLVDLRLESSLRDETGHFWLPSLSAPKVNPEVRPLF